jgi:SAM-dependent methyltransferase
MGKRADGQQEQSTRAKDAISDRELSLMNSRVRELLLRYWDFPLFDSMMQRHGVQLRAAAVLEAGCGSGYSTRMIWERFGPRSIDAFDLDPGQVKRAGARNLPARFFVSDITDTHLASSLYEAVFVCGVLHHCAAWRTALQEVARVLKSGGLLFIEEPTRPFVRFERQIIGPSPANEAWQGLEPVRAAMADAGLGILEERPLYFGLFRSLLCVKMVGRLEPVQSVAPMLLRTEAAELAHGQGVPA